MKNPSLVASSFAQAFADLLPVGVMWPRDPDSTLAGLVDGLAAGANAAHQRSQTLLVSESDPALAIEALSDWERAYGLPDPCVGENQTIQQRRAALLARIAATGGQSRAYFIAVAAALGFNITIEEFRPFRLGYSAFGEALLEIGEAFRWRVNAPELQTIYFRFGQSAFGEPFQSGSNAALECVFNRLKPAHTVLEFAYGS